MADVDLSKFWGLDPRVVYLNHGSFGACPTAILQAQQQYRERMERDPVHFFVREIEGLIDASRRELAAFVGADAEDLAFVPNATVGVNTVLRSLDFRSGDELLTTNHAYPACKNAIDFVASRTGARVVVAAVPFPLASSQLVLDSILARVTPSTRLALIDHVTSPTGLVFPIARIVQALNERGVETLVDGAHAPGMVPLDLRSLGAAYFTANCHKWLCTPKGSALLFVRRDRQHAIHPLAISHGATAKRPERSRFWLEFDWTGTDDPTPYLCVGDAIRYLGGLLPGGWQALMERNRFVALAAREMLCSTLGIPEPAPRDMVAALAAVPLPDQALQPGAVFDPLQDALFREHGIEIPIFPWPAPPKRVLRVSAQLYNSASQYQKLIDALRIAGRA
jgi:isopenicillin-N epimerase